MMPDLVVHCSKEGRRFRLESIRLLVANPLQITRHPELWPTDGSRLWIACPACKLVSAHCFCETVGFPDDQIEFHRDKVWWSISFRCAVEGCNTPAQFHVLMGTTVTETIKNDVREKLGKGYWKGVLPCDHPISITNDQRVHFGMVPGRMQGYSPDDSQWHYI